jgi:hypothetical protein
MQSVQEEGQARLEDSLITLLGQDRLLQFKEYQQTSAARNLVGGIGNTLALAGQPLASAQLRPLVSAMAAAQKRQQGELQAVPRPANPAAVAQQREQQLRRSEESNRILLEAAERFLTPAQLAIYRAQLEAQVAQTRASIRLQQERDRVQRAMQGERN